MTAAREAILTDASHSDGPAQALKQTTVTPAAKHLTTYVTRRMVCGGLAGMIAKVCFLT